MRYLLKNAAGWKNRKKYVKCKTYKENCTDLERHEVPTHKGCVLEVDKQVCKLQNMGVKLCRLRKALGTHTILLYNGSRGTGMYFTKH